MVNSSLPGCRAGTGYTLTPAGSRDRRSTASPHLGATAKAAVPRWRRARGSRDRRSTASPHLGATAKAAVPRWRRARGSRDRSDIGLRAGWRCTTVSTPHRERCSSVRVDFRYRPACWVEMHHGIHAAPGTLFLCTGRLPISACRFHGQGALTYPRRPGHRGSFPRTTASQSADSTARVLSPIPADPDTEAVFPGQPLRSLPIPRLRPNLATRPGRAKWAA